MRSVLMDAALHLAWQQWTALGVAGTLSPPDHAIDLEALICFTPVLGFDDPRLNDEALDWCIFHSRRLVSITRLRHLRKTLSERATKAFDRFAGTVNASARLKTAWPTDHRGTMSKTSGKSQFPDIGQPALLQLRLRALFGATARAEVLLQFLRPGMTQEAMPSMSLSVSALAEIGYSKPTLSDALADLTMGGLLEKWRRGNRDYYTLARVEPLLGLLGGVLPATAPNWALRFRIAADLLALESETQGKKEVVQAVAISREFERVHDALERASVKQPILAHDWREVGKWAVETLLLGSPQPEGFGRFRQLRSS